ncbi:hypothetical protein AMECASPLE_036311 [Ameca splendens]|uniref:Uncharacterized protein n=1 Tax=Ameca splendens TaxID=208324 RepID=A0ABV1A2Z0_9TELE
MEYKKVELSALQCLSVCLCGDFKSKPLSSCNFQPWLKTSQSLRPPPSESCSSSSNSQVTFNFLKPNQTQQQSHSSPWLHIILPHQNSPPSTCLSACGSKQLNEL